MIEKSRLQSLLAREEARLVVSDTGIDDQIQARFIDQQRMDR
jgi:hypothetical protein